MAKTIKVFDGTEVEYVEVHDEPIHRHQFNNEYVYVYIVGFRPGETSLWHRHSENTFYVCLEHAVTALNRPSDKAPYMHHAFPGDMWWAMSKSEPFVHQVCLPPENSHSSKFFAMEILKSPPIVSHSPLLNRCYVLRKDFSRPGLVRVYDFKLEPGESTGPHTWGFCGIVVCLCDGGKGIDVEAGSDDAHGSPFEDEVLSRVGGWKWVDGPVGIDVRNRGDGLYHAVVVEWLDGIGKGGTGQNGVNGTMTASPPGDLDPVERVEASIQAVEKEIQLVGAKLQEIEAVLRKGGSYLGMSDRGELLEERTRLMRKEEQLRAKKGHLRAKERVYRKPLLQAGVTKKLEEFSSRLVDATLSDNILQLPEGVFFPGHREVGSKIFIRQCYVEIADIIFSGVREDTMRNIVCNGTPGIGKSVFALYLLYLLRVKGETIVFDFKGRWYHFSDAQGVEKGNLRDFIRTTYLEERSSWLLCNPKEEPYDIFHGVTVVTICLDQDRTNEFLKQHKQCVLYMPSWTSEELQQCRSLVYPHISEDVVEDSFDQVGGTAREAFDKTLLERRVGRMEGRAQKITIQDLQDLDSAGQIRSTRKLVEVGDTLFAIQPDNTYKAFEISIASSLARSSTRETVVENQRNQLNSLWPAYMSSLSKRHVSVPGSVGGVLFEGLARVSLEDSGKTGREFRRYIFGEGVGNVSFTFHNSKCFEGREIPSKLSPDTCYSPPYKP